MQIVLVSIIFALILAEFSVGQSNQEILVELARPVPEGNPDKVPVPLMPEAVQTLPAKPVGEEVTPVAAMNAATLLPIGVPSYNVRMPEFANEKLISRMKVEKLVRIDDSRLDLLNLDLERYRPDGELDYVVIIERGFYDLNTGRLVSSSPTRIRGRDLDMYGGGCDYAKDVELIKILGNVTSYFYLNKEKKNKPKGDANTKE